MPVVFSFDLENPQPNEHNRIQSMFERLGWQNMGGSSYRYPRLGSDQPVEDWFNHVVPALMLFRSFIQTSGRRLRKYTLDVNSSTGFLGKYGAPPKKASIAQLYQPRNLQFGEKKLCEWINGVTFPY